MSALTRFFKENKAIKENTTYPATSSLTDQNGKPLDWIIRPISTKKHEMIRDECTRDVPVVGKTNLYRPKFNSSQYITKLICESVVEPNLNDKELQDSYGVMSAEELILEMIDDPGEYANFAQFIQEFNGFATTLEDKIEIAKN